VQSWRIPGYLHETVKCEFESGRRVGQSLAGASLASLENRELQRARGTVW
jgi:hypothetical protein